MGFAQILSRAQVGLAAPLVRVEVHLGSGLPTFSIVGLPAPVVRESKERVRAALAHCGFEFPAGRITVNLAPADLPKVGGRFDLPIALGILVASGQVQPPAGLAQAEFYGELGLTGELKGVPGLLPAALQAIECGHALHVPAVNASDLADALCADVHALKNLRDVAGGEVVQRPSAPMAAGAPPVAQELADVRGQWQAKRALIIAAAGAHNLLMIGPPGSGKSMLAQRLPALLPPMSRDEALEVAAIAAVSSGNSGQMPAVSSLCRPFRAPHHTASAHAIVGGGSSVQPGEVSLAHHGVLFLDELPEFDRRVLESLREPLESGRVSVVRTSQRAEFPAAFQLIAAMNPCRCGRAASPARHASGSGARRCSCTPAQIAAYRARVSGPLLDRIDLQLELPRVDTAELTADVAQAGSGPTTTEVRQQVCAARQRQMARQGRLNARLDAAETFSRCRPVIAGRELLRRAAAERGYSARSQHRVLRVARTIADLADREEIGAADVAEALALRWEGQ